MAIDRTGKCAGAPLVERTGKMEAAGFLRGVVKAVPYTTYPMLTDNGTHFTSRERVVHDSLHIFDRVCDEHRAGSAGVPSGGPLRDGFEHRLTKVNHPWTNGQVERMHRTLKDATVKRYVHKSHDELRATSNSSWMSTTTPAA